MTNFLICVNGVVPIFLLIGIGLLLRRIRIMDEVFCEKATTLVFRLVLPVMIFHDIAVSDIGDRFDGRILAAAMISTLIMFFVVWGLSLLATKDIRQRAAFSQGAFRANYAILGLPLTKALFGAEAAANAAVILAVSMVIFNVLAVVYLEMFLNRDGGVRGALLGVAKNPIIIAAVLGSAVYLLHIPLVPVLDKTIGYISQMCVPLSLLTIGASMHYKDMKKTFSLALFASLIKTIATPLLFTIPCILLGFRGEGLGVLLIYWGAPAAVAGYAMTRDMGGDYDLAGNIIMLSTLISFFTVFFSVLLLKNMGFVS